MKQSNLLFNGSAASKTAVGVAVAVLLMLAWSSFVTVGPGERGVLMTFGAVHPGVLAPGLHLKLPIIQGVKKMNVQIQKSETEETAASRDLQDVATTVAVNWSIDPGDAEWVYQQLGDEAQLATKVIDPIVSNAVKAVAAHYNAEELIEKRDAIRAQIQTDVLQSLAAYRVKVEGVNITNFRFSSGFTNAIEQKQVAQQKAQKADYDLQRIKVEAQQQIAEAQGQAQAQKLLQVTLTPEIIELKAVTKWNGVLPQVVGGNGTIPMIGPTAAPALKGGAAAALPGR